MPWYTGYKNKCSAFGEEVWMPARIPPAAEQPIHTPSFVCEVPLRVNSAQERTLLARLEAAR
jgi:hypothetical protein